MKMYIYSHNPHSEGAKLLSQALNVKRIKHGNSKFRGGMGKALINWGSGKLPDQAMACEKILNHPNAIINASNKLKSFELFQEAGVTIPPFFTSKEQASAYMEENPNTAMVCRTVLNGHSGVGIHISDRVDALVEAPLYTAYVKKQEEYRYHVFMGQVVDIQRKARKRDVPDDAVNWQVRNLDGGFIFAREGVVASPVASEEAVKAVESLSLDFGAVDLIYNAREDKYYVLEVNTAPGLSGTTLDGYKQRFQEVFNG
jgi:glutathione synthase/RimK-type ligase-like ATP-grasp enzyme